MELLQLEYFKTVAELEHITKAADKLLVSQPTLSAAIQRLEFELGTQLFDRKGRGITLNACGQLFLSYVNSILFQLEKAKSAVRDYVRQQKNTIVIDGTSLYVFKGLVDIILSEYPNTIITYAPRANTLKQALESLEVDFCITTKDFSSNTIISYHLTDEPLVLVVPSKSQLAKCRSVSLANLSDYNFAVQNQHTFLWASIKEQCLTNGFNPKITYEGKNVFSAVKSGNHITLALKYYTDSIADPDMTVLNVDYIPRQPVFLSYAKKQEENIFVSSIIDIIKEYFKTM